MEAHTYVKSLAGATFLAMAVTLTVACSPDAAKQNNVAAQASGPVSIAQVRVINTGTDDEAMPQPLSIDKPIVMKIKLSGTAQNGNLEAKVFALSNGEVKQTKTQALTAENGDEVEIALDDTRTWKPGRYLVEIRLNEKLATQHEFEIPDLRQMPPG